MFGLVFSVAFATLLRGTSRVYWINLYNNKLSSFVICIIGAALDLLVGKLI